MVDDSVAVTPFYLLLGKHRQQQEALTNPMAERIQLPQGSIAIKEVCMCARAFMQGPLTIYLRTCK
jgi:hypothetical protein